MVVTYWYVFMIVGTLLFGYAVWRQVMRMRELMESSRLFMKDLGNIYLSGSTPPRVEQRRDPFSGMPLQILCAFVGAVCMLIGFIGLIVGLVNG
jgi:hypothetical protein